MKDNGLLEHYRSFVSKKGFVDVDKLPMQSGLEYIGFGNHIQTLTDESGKKYYVKKCTDTEQCAEVLLSQVFSNSGFNSAIYLPAGKNKVISNDIGRNGEVAQNFFLRKVAEERAQKDPRSAEVLLNSLDVNARTLGLGCADRYVKYMIPECAEKYFEMRGFDVAAKNTDRHLYNYFFESNSEGLASQLNLFDYGFSAINHKNPVFLEPNYCSMIGGLVHCDRDLLLWQLAHHDDVTKFVNSQELAEKIGSVDIIGTAKDITQTTGFKFDQRYVDNMAHSFCVTANNLAQS